ncbi:MAG: hypothetical protein WCF26_20740 [Candidatus Sulfotelmatobacter sp.]
MKARERLAPAAQLLLIFPAVLFLGALVVRNLSPLQEEPAHMAQQIVMWYAGRMWTLWILLIALPFGVLMIGCITFAHNWSGDAGLRQGGKQALAVLSANGAMLVVGLLTLTAGVILAIVTLHMLAN